MSNKAVRRLLIAVCLGGALTAPQLLKNDSNVHVVAAGNSGDVKISPDAQPAHGLQGNDPHVQCQFYVLGFNFASAQGTITIDSWPPTGNRAVVLTDSYVGSPDGSGTYGIVNGPYSLPAGHYKLYTTDNKGATITKDKVFWVDGCSATPTPTIPTDTPSPIPPTPTATFPTG